MIKKESKNVARVRRHERVLAKIYRDANRKVTPRLCVYRSNKHIEAQIIDDIKRVTLVASSSVALKLENGGNIEAAAKVGEDIAKKALALNINTVIFDRSGYIYHGRVKALAEGARKGGLKF